VRIASEEIGARWDFWVLKEALLRALMAVLAVEISVRVFGHLPGARRWAWSAAIAIIVGTGMTIGDAHGVRLGDAYAWPRVIVVDVLPRLAVGAVLLCLSVLLVMARFRVPIDPLHRAVLFGVAAFLVVYAGPLGSAEGHPIGRFVVYHVTPLIYLGVLSVWAWAAWRVEPRVAVGRALLERVQPWQRTGRS
jgi:hypothetical protein